MAKSELIARQSRLPTGWLGEIVARVMSLETIPANAAALDELEPSSYEAVLEVGCGHGSGSIRVSPQGKAEYDSEVLETPPQNVGRFTIREKPASRLHGALVETSRGPLREWCRLVPSATQPGAPLCRSVPPNPANYQGSLGSGSSENPRVGSSILPCATRKTRSGT